jgi:uncharacterized protein YndB with AHSA1/START domain
MTVQRETATERELVLTRVFDAPRELLFEAWTDAAHLAQWWGPRGFTNPVCELDVRPGGAIRITMRGPDGRDYPMEGVFREIVEPERLVFTNNAVDADGKPLLEGLTTVTFADLGGRTKLTLQTRAEGTGPYTARMLEGMDAGWAQSIEKLEEELGGFAERQLVFTRFFNSPRDRVFTVFTATNLDRDTRPVYLEVVRPERLVYHHAGENDGEPVKFHVTVTFHAMGENTIVTMRMLFDSPAERDAAVKKYDAEEGAVQAMERLRAHLAGL